MEEKHLYSPLEKFILIQFSNPCPEEAFSHFQLAFFAPHHPGRAGDTISVRALLPLAVVPAPERLK
jgi:hypothetical protein